MIIGLTGGSGTGKSSACSFFREKGFKIIDSDRIARQVCQKGTDCLNEIVLAFGDGILDANGNLKRKELGSIVFSDKDKLKTLNEITHKYIIRRIKEIIKCSEGENIVIDAPLLFETTLDSLCTKTVCILSSEKERAVRIAKRDGISEEEAKKRIASQKDDSFYISHCDYAFYNNSTMQDLLEKLAEVLGGI